MAETRYLQRFEFFRNLMNSHRELAAWWATGDAANKDEMMKWVLEPSQIGTATPYPILKTPGKYPSVVNIDAANAPTIGDRNTGKKLGELAVHIQMGSGGAQYGAPVGAAITTSDTTLVITDKDFEHFNFNYGKVQLPYYNDVGTNNYRKASASDASSRVVTGWKIVSITGGTAGSYTTDADDATTDSNGNITKTPYNFADRNCTNKDLYSVSGRVFNQGAYWDVPEGVTGITIQPYWARCVYLADPNADKVYNQGMTTGYDVPNVGGGQIYTNGNSYSIAGENQLVYTTMSNAISSKGSALFSGVDANTHTVYDYAVVLVGNYHHYGALEASNAKPYTVTSIDLDGDNEPDYSYILRFDGRLECHPVRADFINIPGLGMAQKSTGSSGSYNFGIMIPKGWFETTNTSLSRFTQFEYEHKDHPDTAPLILQGGVMEQWVSYNQKGISNKIPYIHIGGNVWFKEFHTGCHQDRQIATKHSPISVTGGDFDEFYLTGLYRGDITSFADNAECYINGGRFGIVCGAAMEGIGKANGADNTGNIVWSIQNADIKEFYAGGLNAAKPVTGNLSTTITGSHVDFFCGGPKFGNMSANKTVVTNATNCEFGTYFGGGYGGNSYSRQAPRNHNNIVNFPHNDNEAGNHASWNAWLNAFYKQNYSNTYGGISTQFSYQFLPMSSNVTNVARIFVDYVSFSTATTRNVTSNLTGCTITGSFYGGGSLGKVEGPVTSTLDNCTVNGNVFGAGYSAKLPTIEVDSVGFRTEPYYYTDFGTYRYGVKGQTTTYTWGHANTPSIDKTNKIIYTTENLDGLGTVSGLARLTITGNTVVNGDIYDEEGNITSDKGGVFGGGDESDALGNTEVNIQAGATSAIINVFGGGNTADVLGDTEVNMTSGNVTRDIYGGGKGKTTTVSGDVTVNIGAKDGGGALSGTGNIGGDVYGGSALGDVNATKEEGYDFDVDPDAHIAATAEKTTNVYIYGGAITGSVFGGGRGSLAVGTLGDPGYEAPIDARNFTNTAVTMEGGTVATAVYGGSNTNGVLKGTSTVTITGGSVGTLPAGSDPYADVVFGGGYGRPTIVQGAVRVDIGTSGQESGGATFNGHIYGGGALGSVNSSTEVNLNKGTINGNVFGGGLGKQAVAAVAADPELGIEAQPAKPAINAVVGGNATVTLDGASLTYSGVSPKTGQIFGGNNLQGSPSGHIKVHVKRTIPVSEQPYDVAAVYGGGNEADYNPTADDYAQVIIEGCNISSIKDVYGGGNAAAVPATEVLILGDKIIENVFGGGNGELGADHAAHVGFHRESDLSKTNYTNGTGKTEVKLVGGTITNVYGGSNSNGDIRGGAYITMPPLSEYSSTYDCCSTLTTEHIYGGGKNADMSGGTNIVLGCMPNQWIDEIYAGAQNADVEGDVSLTITSGMFKRVFGGNKDGGKLKGSITVNIEETGGCDTPILIGELYGGGNLAGYSIYGYDGSGNPRTEAQLRTDISGRAENDGKTEEQLEAIFQAEKYDNPQLNIRAFTSIGSVYGGGYQAQMIADPHVDINVVKGSHAATAYAGETLENVPIKKKNESTGLIEDATIDITLPAHAENKIGTIGNVYGGGNLADVTGDAEVNIGTETTVGFVTEPVHRRAIPAEPMTPNAETGLYDVSVDGANITGNVYGGGQDAVIAGNTQVNICAKKGEGETYNCITANSSKVAIGGAVYGGGKGESTNVNNTKVVMGGGAVAHSVYGGGEFGCIEQNTDINIMAGAIGDPDNERGGETYGNVYGGGKGECDKTKPSAGLIKGNTNINITGGNIYHNVYGGGAYGSVGTYTVVESVTECAEGTGSATININGGTIGINGKENGMVFGSSRGEVAKPTGSPAEDPNDYLAWVNETHVTIGDSNNETPDPVIKGSVYGSGENGHTYKDTEVIIKSGTIGINSSEVVTYYKNNDVESDVVYSGPAYDYPYRGNVYGGGCGTDQYDSDSDGIDDTYNPKSGWVGGTASVTIDGGTVVRDVYGGGSMGSVGGSTSVEISGNAVIGASGSNGGYVYAATRGDASLDDAHQAYVAASSLTISGGTINGDAYGGGQNGIVKGAVTVSLSGGEVKHDVYGGGALAKTNTEYLAGDPTKGTYATTVTMSGDPGITIRGNLYGGGLGRKAEGAVLYANVTEYNTAKGTSLTSVEFDELSDAEKTKTAAVIAIPANVNGPVTVNVSSGTVENVFGCNNLNGAPQVSAAVNIGGGIVNHDVFGGGNQSDYGHNTSVTMTGGRADRIFGGGSEADVAGSVTVTISGGKVVNDVYGGGALANTNTANWTLGAPRAIYVDITYALTEDKTEVTGLYEKTGETTYAPTEDATAGAGKHYYERRMLPGDWAAGKTSASNTTTLTLTGGIFGNVYGGGLGDTSTPVYVFGDVSVIINKPADITSNGGLGAAFSKDPKDVTVSGVSYTAVPNKGRVFGCNNVKGTPLGNVLVEVYGTRQIDNKDNYVAGHKNYEIQAVYGGGNQADYVPDNGKSTTVNIYGCDESSIARVYGGGNSASVPKTNVTIWGSYDIEYAFGGGNGGQPVLTSSGWVANAGANVIADANITCHGGRIGEIFGGSDFLGTCRQANSTQSQSGDCPLRITKLYGAGKEAEVDGDVNVVISACTAENSQIEYVCGGSYKAQIKGGIHLTITAGYFKNVYGGNDQRGSIGGDIIVDVEETDPCKPIIIGNLVGGGNQAAFPGKYEDGTPLPDLVDGKLRNIKVNVKSATRIENIYGGSFMAETRANTEVNVNMLQGRHRGSSVLLPSDYGLVGARIPANITGVTTSYVAVSPAIESGKSVVGYYTRVGETDNYVAASGTSDGSTTYYEKQISGTIKSEIGTIGNVYGGGQQGQVKGNTKVNIGNLTTVQILHRNGDGIISDAEDHPIYDVDGKLIKDKVVAYDNQTVRGAHIDGNVYGGGEMAEVTGSSEVNICTAETTPGSGTYVAVAEGAEKVTIGGSVYGGGSQADVLTNATVRMYNGYVFNGIFGGGYAGSVGTFTRSTDAAHTNVYGHTSHAGCIGKPISCKVGTGKCTVVVNGGQIGPVTVATQGMTRSKANGGPVAEGWVWGAGCGVVEDPADEPDTHFKTYVNETDVTIGGTAFVLESIIGGGEFGRVLGNTLVKIEGGQIGVGANQTEEVNGELKPKRYTDAQFVDPRDGITALNALAECSHFDYGRTEDDKKVYRPYDPYYEDYPSYVSANPDLSPASTSNPSDGKTWIGCVWGGGSGYFPYVKSDGSGYEWLRSAGLVEGNAEVRISGGHILTNVYGANEITDVKGKATVKMTGGTIGVPRTLEQIAIHPLSCYLFGGGKGDQRSHFDQWTTVDSVEIDISGGIIYGSVFGGSEDGHVLGNVDLTIRKGADFTIGGKTYTNGPIIGSWGTSYVDGNVFGGGRGFSGETLGAGSVTGDININIQGGTMLGSVYGGGRMASVGLDYFDSDDPLHGQFIEDDGDDTYGHITVNISGGTIGNTNEDAALAADGHYHTKGGNVYGGSMGRLELLDGTVNPKWPRLAQAKTATINITGDALIKNSVYGGGEFGNTRDNVYITVGGTRASNGTITPSGTPTINGHVYGGGYGSTIDSDGYKASITAADTKYIYTPMQWAGLVGGNTEVNICGGHVKKNVYGGGEYASVGVIDYSVNESDEYIKIHKHDRVTDKGTINEQIYDFGLSWPYEFSYLMGGRAEVNVTGGRVGTTLDSGYGYVFGGGKGQAMDRYREAFLANVKETDVNIAYTSAPADTTKTYLENDANAAIVAAIYGGAEDGHVYMNTAVDITEGLIGMSAYGGGKGRGTYRGHLRNKTTGNWETGDETLKDLLSWTAGKVYGNCGITVSGGRILRNVYGGGNRASVGKGNYSSGTDDYYTTGYGEKLEVKQWTSDKEGDFAWHFLNSGNTYVKITSGIIGNANGVYDGMPTGMVFGGSRGQSAEDVFLAPRYDYEPNFYLGYVNRAHVVIGQTDAEVSAGALTPPMIWGSVYGGGRDGHVRDSAEVVIHRGTIGPEYNSTNKTLLGTSDVNNHKWRDCGNVYGSGSGMGTWDATHHALSSGSVTRRTRAIINGGTIYNNVYGGGAMSSVGPPLIGTPGAPTDYAGKDISLCYVQINGGNIGTSDGYAARYGGSVYGASRGGDFVTGESEDDYATTIWTKVDITGGNIAGDVYGGGQASRVKKDTEVNLTGGDITHDAYGGGQGSKGARDIAAHVGGNTKVELNKGVAETSPGCKVSRIFGCNNILGSPRGNVTVHVYSTQNRNKTQINQKYDLFHNISGYSITAYDGLVTLAEDTYGLSSNIASYKAILSGSGTDEAKNAALKAIEDSVLYAELKDFASAGKLNLNVTVYTDIIGATGGSYTAEQKSKALEDMQDAVYNAKYDVLAVYGGGNLATYQPYGDLANNTADDFKATTKKANVIIDGCHLTSIRQVYGGGNAAPTPANTVNVYGTYEIDELFGGGNGKDPFQDVHNNDKWYANQGANVGYYDYVEYVTDDHDTATNGDGSSANPYVAHTKSNASSQALRELNYSYGTGIAETNVLGGRIHYAYGGSNMKGNIRTRALSNYETSTECPVIIDKTYGAGKDASLDGEIRVVLECVDYMAELFGGSTKGDVYSDVDLIITNGHFGAVYGGNDKTGHVYGSIKITVKESGCNPIVIDRLYAGGLQSDYSVYGYYTDTSDGNKIKPRTYDKFKTDSIAAMATVTHPDNEDEVNAAMTAADLYGYPKAHPQIDIISATKIGAIYGGGEKAVLIGTPHINVNMEEGHITAKYVDENPSKFALGTHTVSDTHGDYTFVVRGLENGKAILGVGTIDNIYGGGDQAVVDGDTHIEIGTGMHHVKVADHEEFATLEPYRDSAKVMNSVYGGGRGLDATVTGNTFISMGKGASVENRIFGGGDLGSVGTVTATSAHTGDKEHAGCIGKPTAFKANTGRCTIDIFGGRVGPFGMKMITDSIADDYGYVFGASKGNLADPASDKDIDFKTYVNETYVTIRNAYEKGYEGGAADSLSHIASKPIICGGVYGGSENGRVLNDTHVFIQGGQIGVGRELTSAYAEADFINPATATVSQIEDKSAVMPECEAWTFESPWTPYDENADKTWYTAAIATMGAAGTVGTDGHTFYGNVFGGGSGYFTYEKSDGSHEWLPTAGLVEGDTYLNITGGHIISNVYGGNEMTDVTGTCHINMTGGTVGVPRTLEQIIEHPVVCNIFGGGKGDQRVHFNKSTNVGGTDVKITGGIVYGSVFGGGEDGHVMRNTSVTIGKDDHTGPTIGTWGISNLEGNVFGGGRGFSGDAYTAGNVAGSANTTIKGGNILGSVYGGGRIASVGYGLYLVSETGKYGTIRPDNFEDDGTTPVANFKRGYTNVTITGGTIGNRHEFIMPTAANIPLGLDADFKNWSAENWTTWKEHNRVPHTIFDTSNGRVTHSTSGNVYAGSMGRRTKIDGVTPNDYPSIEWKKLGNVKATKLAISGATTWILGNVYGGGELGSVKPYVNGETVEGGTTQVDITEGVIGVEVRENEFPQKATIALPGTYPASGSSAVKYTYGSVYGGGMGDETYGGGDILDNGASIETLRAKVSISGADTKVRASVFGGGEQAIVSGSTQVNISNGEVGRDEVQPKNGSNRGYVMFGSSTMGNVYGGGKGSTKAVVNGLVKGNTTVNISGGKVYHMVYGGGALGSVGDFKLSDGADNPIYIPIANVPYGWDTEADGETANGNNTGNTTVNITGGVIGISGRDNGLVFGASRGDLKNLYAYYTAEEIAAASSGDPAYGKIAGDPYKKYDVDPYDSLAWVKSSVVNIGTDGPSDLTSPLIKGSVYGGAENGHNSEDATVNIYSGTIGIMEKDPSTGLDDPWWDFGDNDLNNQYRNYRGNVYGAGSGADTYSVTKGGTKFEYYNSKSGMVGGNTEVNISGGMIGRNVYGGGAMSSVGRITNENDTIQGGSAKNSDPTNSFAMSWPYKVIFAEGTGKTTVNVRGGHIGMGSSRIVGIDNGNIYGGSRGEGGDPYAMSHRANVAETHVTVDFEPASTDPAAMLGSANYGKACIEGSVFGGGENGHVFGDTHVIVKDGFVSHSLFGGGRGEGQYKRKLIHVQTGEGATPPYTGTTAVMTGDIDVFDWLSGKVYGNTHLTLVKGRVLNNVLGGGYMASVGIGNYAGGADDFYPNGYGEKITGDLWTPSGSFNPRAPITSLNMPTTNADFFLATGKTFVDVFGGVIGSTDLWDGLPAGSVFGGCRGKAAPDLRESKRHLYAPEWFNGYCNETHVTIGGGYKCKTECTDKNGTVHAVEDMASLQMLQELFDGDDLTTNWEKIDDSGIKIYGSVYGGAQDGRVRRDANVVVNAGEIGLPFTSANRTLLVPGAETIQEELDSPQWLHRGNVYGSGSGIGKYKFDLNYDGDSIDTDVDYYGTIVKEEDYSKNAGCVLRFTQVDINGGIIHRNVYGGGSMGSVGPPAIPPRDNETADKKGDTTTHGGKTGWQSQCTVNIRGEVGTPNDAVKGWTYQDIYGGEVYGACRGIAELKIKENQFSHAVWTKVNILRGAIVHGNVFGAGDSGMVKKDSEVVVGMPDVDD